VPVGEGSRANVVSAGGHAKKRSGLDGRLRF
jgi:hypothetical protein